MNPIRFLAPCVGLLALVCGDTARAEDLSGTSVRDAVTVTQASMMPVRLERRSRRAQGAFALPVLGAGQPHVAAPDLTIDHDLHDPSPQVGVAPGVRVDSGAEDEDDGGGGQDLAKTSQNPVGDLISVPFQSNTRFGQGAHDRTGSILNIQPVIPISLSKSVNLITRTIIPISSQPHGESTDGRTSGLGDINPTFFFTPAKPGKVIWGVGPTFLLPTSTDRRLGSGRWAAGPSIVVLTMPGSWVLGALAANLWSIDDASGPDINLFSSQVFVTYNLPGGWYLTSAPIITANWNAPSGERWTVPVGGGFGRVTKFGKQPVSWSLQGYYLAERPTGAGDFELRLQLALLFPKGG